jgi:hypothetical protein
MSDTLERLRKVAPIHDHREFATVRVDLLTAAATEIQELQSRLHSAELLLSRASGRLADGEELGPRAGQLIEDIADYFNKQRVVERQEIKP